MAALHDLSKCPGAFRAQKLPIPVIVIFAESDGELETPEGVVAYRAGDAILTGVEHERWPVPRNKFLLSYQAFPPTVQGEPGEYVKHPQIVWCLRADKPMTVELRDSRGQLHAKLGDVVVQYSEGDLAVVSASIFDASYQICDS